MRDFNILTPGEKIKKIRIDFDIKQEDLAGSEITRNLISIMENNKANLTESTAKILTQNINRICKEKDINFSVTEEYLLEDVVSQAKKIADDYIEYINNLSKDKINSVKDVLYEINFFCKNYKLEEKKSELYMAIGKNFKLNRQYLKALDYYLKAFESSTDKTITINALLNLGICSSLLSMYDDAIDYFNLILDLDSTPEDQYYASFNIALCYQRLGKFEDSLQTLDKISETHRDTLSNSKETYIKVNLLKGICFYELKSFNNAIKLYKDLLKIEEIGNDEILILSALSDVYRSTHDSAKLEKVCNKITTYIDSCNGLLSKYESDVYVTLSKNLKALNRCDKITPLLLKALESFKSGKSAMYFDDVENLIKDLLDVFIQDNDEANIYYLKNEFFELIEKGSFPRLNSITLKFIKYYNLKGQTKEIDNLVDFLAV